RTNIFMVLELKKTDFSLSNKKAVSKLIVTIILLGILLTASVYAIQSSLNNGSSIAVLGQSYVPVPGALVSASGDNGSGGTTADSSGNYNIATYLGTGTYSVTASAPGYIDQQVD